MPGPKITMIAEIRARRTDDFKRLFIIRSADHRNEECRSSLDNLKEYAHADRVYALAMGF